MVNKTLDSRMSDFTNITSHSNMTLFEAAIYTEQGTISQHTNSSGLTTHYYAPSQTYALEVKCDSPLIASLVAIFMNSAIKNKPVSIDLNNEHLNTVSAITHPEYVIIRYRNMAVLRTTEEKTKDGRSFYDLMKTFCKEKLNVVPKEEKIVMTYNN